MVELPVSIHSEQASPTADMRVQLLEQLLSSQLLPVLFVFADDRHFLLVDYHGILIFTISNRFHFLMNVRIPETIVPLETCDQDLVWSRLTCAVTEVGNPGILDKDSVKKCKVRGFSFPF